MRCSMSASIPLPLSRNDNRQAIVRRILINIKVHQRRVCRDAVLSDVEYVLREVTKDSHSYLRRILATS